MGLFTRNPEKLTEAARLSAIKKTFIMKVRGIGCANVITDHPTFDSFGTITYTSVFDTVSIYALNNGKVMVSHATPRDRFDLSEYELKNVEYVEDIKNNGKSVVGRAAVGGALLGPLGAVIGGVTGKDKIQDNSKVILTLHNPAINVDRIIAMECNPLNLAMLKCIPKS